MTLSPWGSSTTNPKKHSPLQKGHVFLMWPLQTPSCRQPSFSASSKILQASNKILAMVKKSLGLSKRSNEKAIFDPAKDKKLLVLPIWIVIFVTETQQTFLFFSCPTLV